MIQTRGGGWAYSTSVECFLSYRRAEEEETFNVGRVLVLHDPPAESNGKKLCRYNSSDHHSLSHRLNIGTDGWCLPRRRMPFISMKEDSQLV